ncbi:MAG TPA: type I restriction endonuclease, partial [Spirochaetia bacterium]|nr:type I restriction endonuclease [Spirochaetia bacterium]
MSDIHLEKHFESDLVDYLTTHGWQEGASGNYDQDRALYTGDALAWARTAHAEAWKRLESQYGTKAEEVFLSRLVAELDSIGTLAVLRHGFKIVGAGGSHFALLQAKPRSGRNPEAAALYGRNVLRVVRQVFYSRNNKNSIDLVLFVNGLPVATIELKTESTQSVHAAIKQYRKDRLPRDGAANTVEPLLQFKSRCVVHFAVSTEEVWMTTRLAGKATFFLPFNKGDNEGKGNPVNHGGPRTAYLWEEVLERDAWIHILTDFVHLEKAERTGADGRKSVSERMIFPRYHQWDAVTRLVDTSRQERAGHRYLIQHSAGSGKSNSIAWLAHHLSSLHDEADEAVFDAVIVITDRTVLDSQLRDTIYQFQKTLGVVEGITNE